MTESQLFTDLDVFIVPAKIEPPEFQRLFSDVTSRGGRIKNDDTNANLIVTNLKNSAERLSWYVRKVDIPIVSPKYILDCVKANQLLDQEDYRLHDLENKLTLKIAAENAARLMKKRDSAKAETGPNKRQRFYKSATGSTSLSSSSRPSSSDASFNSSDLEEDGSGFEEDEDDEEDIPVDPDYKNTPYECLRKHPLHPEHNQKLISLLKVLENQRNVTNQPRNANSYRRAIAALTSYPREIRSSKEARKIVGFGKKMAWRVKEFLKTGTIAEAEKYKDDEDVKVLTLFRSIYGVGPKTAIEWLNKGYRDLETVLQSEKLDKAQRIAIELHDQLSTPVSRADTEEIYATIQSVLDEIAPGTVLVPVGGYRRGKELSGDVDMLISHPRVSAAEKLLNKLVQELIQRGHIKHTLTTFNATDPTPLPETYNRRSKKSLPSSQSGMDLFPKCFSVFQQPSSGILRQVDIVAVPPKRLPFAIVGWSGSTQFERSLRLFVKKERGLHYAGHGLFSLETGELIEVKDERDFFDKCGMEYIEPELRNA